MLTALYWIAMEGVVTLVKSTVDGGLPSYWPVLAPMTVVVALALTYPLYLGMGLISALSIAVQAVLGSVGVLIVASLLRLAIELMTTTLAAQPFGLGNVLDGRFLRDLLVQTGFLAPLSLWFLSLRHHELQMSQAMAEAAAKQQVIQARLAALRYQVNPHFLFNTLNSISTLVWSGENGLAEQMLMKLSAFFRTTLETDVFEEIPLEQEVHLQRLYLDIESVRFPDELRYVFDVQPEAWKALVPSLILQPLIENAVKYGMKAAGSVLTISVEAKREGSMLSLVVRDDGRGLPTKSGSTGIGLKNVRDRLAIRYGTDFEFNTLGSPNGFCVEIKLPWSEDPGDREEARQSV